MQEMQMGLPREVEIQIQRAVQETVRAFERMQSSPAGAPRGAGGVYIALLAALEKGIDLEVQLTLQTTLAVCHFDVQGYDVPHGYRQHLQAALTACGIPVYKDYEEWMAALNGDVAQAA